MKIYCSNCGVDVTEETETEFGIFCPSCHNDFWKSEALNEEQKDNGYYILNLKSWGNRA